MLITLDKEGVYKYIITEKLAGQTQTSTMMVRSVLLQPLQLKKRKMPPVKIVVSMDMLHTLQLVVTLVMVLQKIHHFQTFITEFNNFVVAPVTPSFLILVRLCRLQDDEFTSFLKTNLEMLFKRKQQKANGVTFLTT